MDEIIVKATPRFMRLARKMMTQEAFQDLIDALTLNPEKGDVIKGTGGIRKIRSKTGKGGGKSSGVRIIYYFNGELLVLLFTLYKKSDQENLDAGEKEELRKLIDELIGDL